MKTRIVPLAGATAALLMSLVVWSFPTGAQDGKALFVTKGCPTCHGPEGTAPIAPNYPRLAGQNADYMTVQLKAFRTGERKGPMVALMQPMALTLTDSESELIAKYLQGVK